MRVKLLDSTPNAKELIFAAARQCYSAGWAGDMWQETGDEVKVVDLTEDRACTDKEMETLVSYLKESGHTSVLEHVKFTFAIDGLSRACSHQLVRHRLASFSQQSQRYVNLSRDFSIEDFVVPNSISKNTKALKKYDSLLHSLQDVYNELIKSGIPPEDARYILPNATKTRIVLTMNCAALLHFFSMRSCSLAQWEIRKLSEIMLAICRNVLPIVFKGAGARCEALGYCPESKKRSCGRHPTKSSLL